MSSRRFAMPMLRAPAGVAGRAVMALALFAGTALRAEDAPSEAKPAAPEFSEESIKFFETSVRPLLVERCHKCHGAQKQWANLRLDSREALMRGGDSGPAVVAGKPDESRLIAAVKHASDELKMPPDEPRLADRQIATLVRWVDLGAPFSKSLTAAPSRDPNHWAFQPPVDQPLPQLRDLSWVASPVDAFILARLEAAGVAPAPAADRRTLIRRVTYDLLGLPPTPEEVAEFVADEQPDAYARLVDRLLESPSYGERWGRYWLDVARYADSNGLDENVAHGNAWRYRDYVVSSFNRDKPLDRFILEQLAGDTLPAEDEATRHEHLIATGFLSLGPKVLAETDEAKMRMDIIDEQIESFGRLFLGLTLGCARCHDHKFDPISTADYYALAGVFKSTRTMRKYTKLAEWHENLLPSEAATALQTAHDRKLTDKKQAIAEFLASADKKLADKQPGDGAGPDKPSSGETTPAQREAAYPDETKAALKKLRDELAAIEKAPPELPSAMGVSEDAVVDVAVHVRGNPLKLGDVVARRTPPVLRGPAAPQFSSSDSGRAELARWLADASHPLTARVIANRVWRWHFGRGLVRSVDNFGLVGERPSHPELLDYLARRLVADGWSLKSLHRLILLSSVYQQSSAASPETLAADPENKLYSRAAVRRLEAEAVRDALLAVSGRLERSFGGPALTVPNRGYLFDHTSKDLTDYSSRRRSLYLPVIRNNVYEVFQLLDFPDPATPNGDRATTTVAPQALLMLNSDLVMASADEFAARLLALEADDEGRVDRMVALALGREATAAERTASLALLREVERSLSATGGDDLRRRAWSVVCQVTLASNEFVYVR